MFVAEARDHAVVTHDAAFVEQQAVTRHAHAQVAKTAGIYAIEECARIGPEDLDLAERGDVDESGALAHRAHFRGDALGARPARRCR